MKALLALALLSTPAAAQTPTFADAIGICRAGTFGDPAEARKMLASIAESERTAVLVVCAAYEQGARDALDVIRGAGAKATAI